MRKNKRATKSIAVKVPAITEESSQSDNRALAESSELLTKALGSNDVIIFLKDRVGRYLVMSPWYEKKFYGKRRFIGRTDYDFYQKEFADQFRKNDEMTMDAGTLMEFQEVVPHGERLDTSIAYKFPVFDHLGNVCGVCGFSTPMTIDCKQALETFKMSAGFYSLLFNTIRENEIKYRTLFEAANDAIFLVKDDVLIDCNRKAVELFRCEKDQILGKSFFEFFTEKPARRHVF